MVVDAYISSLGYLYVNLREGVNLYQNAKPLSKM